MKKNNVTMHFKNSAYFLHYETYIIYIFVDIAFYGIFANRYDL